MDTEVFEKQYCSTCYHLFANLGNPFICFKLNELKYSFVFQNQIFNKINLKENLTEAFETNKFEFNVLNQSKTAVYSWYMWNDVT